MSPHLHGCYAAITCMYNQSINQPIINQDILFPLVTQQKTAVIAVSCHQT